MKKLCLLITVTLFTGALPAQPLITYGNQSISKEEFLKAYNKNKPVVTDKEKSLREYLELYSNFKLKVKAASELRLDTLQQIKYDVANFRNQVTENYLSDEKGLKRLQDEAFKRGARDLHVIHFFIPVSNTATPADTMKAVQAGKELYKGLNEAARDYPALLDKISRDYMPARYNDIGFITVFTLPYEYENIIYGTKTGTASLPYRSKNGWHIFKVVEERESAGKWKVAQILFSFPPNASEEIKAATKRRADSVFGLLKSGIAFGTAVKQFSDDRLTYLSNGELPEFGTGKYSYNFEKEVFKLKKDGEISLPFATAYGYHIIKRLGHTPLGKDTADEGYQFELKQKVMKDARINVEKDKFTREIIRTTGFKKTNLVKEQDLYRYADSIMKDPSIERTNQFPISKKTVATFKKGSLTGGDWLRFVREYKSNLELYKGEDNEALWNKFVAVSSVNYYKDHLEEYNTDFKFQMQEFKEGNMLFEIMERNVWNKAISDNAGLLKLYNTNKEKYKWAESADVLVFNCSTTGIAEATMDSLKAGKDWKEIAEQSKSTVQADSGRYEISQIIGGTYTNKPLENSYSPITTGSDGSAAFVKYLKIYPPNLQRNFEEARGLVINDYQHVLEDTWLRSLRQKYPVKINESVFKQLLK